MSPDTPLTLTPIGRIESTLMDKQSAPRQPAAARGVRGCIRLHPETGFEHALSDLSTWSHLWVLFWFHQSPGFRPKVAPPRSAQKRGVFATRAPHRPNPLGLSLLRLERVEGLCVHVLDVDLLDGTPVLDIKPYVPYADTPRADGETTTLAASSGWLPAAEDPGPRYEVHFSEAAAAALAWLSAQGVDWLQAQATANLSLGPTPHPYRRIKPDGDHARIAIRDFRLRFSVEGTRITVLSVHSGYKRRALQRPTPKAGAETPLSIHRAFIERFGP